MLILVTGAKGFVGTSLCRELTVRGDTVIRLVRNNSKSLSQEEIYWDYRSEYIDLHNLEGIDAVIHLAGENILGRWSASKKREIYNSRVKSTEFLSKVISSVHTKPKLFITASAIGVYGNSGNNFVSESTPSGRSFLAEVCRDWECAAVSASEAGIRVANLRIAMVLGNGGGAMAMMAPIFKLGLGGRLGSGKQWMSWISLYDLVRAIIFVLDNDISGPVNAGSPNPVTNSEFTGVLSKAYKRSAFLPVPAFVLKLAFGQMAQEVLLSSCRAYPKRLLDAGFEFHNSCLENTLSELV